MAKIEIPSHLVNECGSFDGRCGCAEPVKADERGRFFIAMGHAGFNSPANNRQGYASKAKALAAHRRYKAAR
jgi:hypothetical protein